MSDLIANCPRCGARHVTFDLKSSTQVDYQYDWQTWWEVFCVCRHCSHATIFVVAEKGIEEANHVQQHGLAKTNLAANKLVNVKNFISLKDADARPAPEHLPKNIKAAFDEGAKCLAVGCFNASAPTTATCTSATRTSARTARRAATSPSRC